VQHPSGVTSLLTLEVTFADLRLLWLVNCVALIPLIESIEAPFDKMLEARLSE
jgi:hypothetical protein